MSAGDLVKEGARASADMLYVTIPLARLDNGQSCKAAINVYSADQVILLLPDERCSNHFLFHDKIQYDDK